MLANMVIGIGADVSGLNKGVDEAGKKVGGLGSKVNQSAASMRKVGTGMSLAVTAPLVGLAKMAGAELSAIETANQQTSAALKRMGPDSLVSVPGVQKLAGALQAISGQDDQLIQTGQNAILTFGAISTSSKLGAKNFATASKVMVNFAEAAGQPVDAAGKQIAKSMAAASQGVLLLPRGMKLGAAETAKLTAVMKSGASPAQKQAALLEVLGQKVQGAAQMTSAEKWDVLQDQLAGVGAELLSTLMPAIGSLVTKLGEWTAKFAGLDAGTKKIIAVVAVVAAVLGPLLIVVGMMIPAVVALAGAATALGGALALVTLPMLAIAAAVVLAIAAGVLLYKNWDTVKEKLGEAWEAIKGAVSAAFTWVKTFVSQHAVAIALAVTGPIGGLVVWMVKNWDTIKTNASTAWAAIKNALALAAGAVVTGITGTIDNIVAGLSLVWTNVRTGITTAWTFITTAATTAATSVVTGITGAIDNVIGAVTGVWTSVRTGIQTAWALILGVAKTEAGQVLAGITGVLDGLPGKLAAIGASAGAALAGAIKTAINGIISKWNSLSFGGFKVGKGKASITVPKVSTPDIPLLAKGGLATGPTLAGIGEYPGANANPEVVAPLDKLQAMLGAGGISITITGNTIARDYDVDRIGDQLISRLRQHGVRL